MIKVKITANEEKQRLDRFLKKYFKNAPLSYIYKLVRKNVKVNGRRVPENTILKLGDEVTIYISKEEADSFMPKNSIKSSKRQFGIAYEDDNIIIVEKPYGLLTHGTSEEKRNTLTNQVIGYLIETQAYNPKKDITFAPSPVNRLDRNTTGLVIFGKNYASLKSLNKMMREREHIKKYYLTIVSGEVNRELKLTDRMTKDIENNKIVVNRDISGKLMETIARPLVSKGEYTLLEVELITGRTHQIRAHLAKAGYPIIGDAKYGDPHVNNRMRKQFALTTQFLHSYRLYFNDSLTPLENMKGKEIISSLPKKLKSIEDSLFN
jgi:23S rRNA pseudouridine955/2504/2580 synthase